MTQAYPLQWPAGRPRNNRAESSRFKTTTRRATQAVLAEIRRMGGVNPVISTNIELRRDGLPYSDRRPPEDKGVAVYFALKGKQMCFACDRWDRIEDNINAIAKSIDALRGIERWGSGSMVEQAFTGFVALPSPPKPWEVLGVDQHASQAEIDAAWREKMKSAHPDVGGSADRANALNEARAQMKGRAA